MVNTAMATPIPSPATSGRNGAGTPLHQAPRDPGQLVTSHFCHGVMITDPSTRAFSTRCCHSVGVGCSVRSWIAQPLAESPQVQLGSSVTEQLPAAGDRCAESGTPALEALSAW